MPRLVLIIPQALRIGSTGEIDSDTDVHATATAMLAAIETALGEALNAMRRSPQTPKAKPHAAASRS